MLEVSISHRPMTYRGVYVLVSVCVCSYCSESSVVEESHRQSLVPILIRLGDGILLYGIDVVV